MLDTEVLQQCICSSSAYNIPTCAMSPPGGLFSPGRAAAPGLASANLTTSLAVAAGNWCCPLSASMAASASDQRLKLTKQQPEEQGQWEQMRAGAQQGGGGAGAGSVEGKTVAVAVAAAVCWVAGRFRSGGL